MTTSRIRRRLHDYLAEGRGHQIQLPHLQFLAEKEKENPRDRQSPWEGRRATGAGTGTETSAHSTVSMSILCSRLPTTTTSHGRFSQWVSGPPWRTVVSCQDPGHMSLVAWLYQAPSRELPLVPAGRTVTNGPPHSQSCKRWTKLAGKTPVREPSPSMKPTWGCRKRLQGSVSLISRYQPRNLSPAMPVERRRCCGDTSVKPSQPFAMHTWGRSPPSMATPKNPAPFRRELEGEKDQDLDPSTC